MCLLSAALSSLVFRKQVASFYGLKCHFRDVIMQGALMEYCLAGCWLFAGRQRLARTGESWQTCLLLVYEMMRQLVWYDSAIGLGLNVKLCLHEMTVLEYVSIIFI